MMPAYGTPTMVNGGGTGYYDSGSTNTTPVQPRGSSDVRWETDTVTFRRAPRVGFGIAVSGGRDNPHFSSGETSIVVSDVAPNGPAEGLLATNDRILSVNGESMDDVYHSDAVGALRQSGDTVTIIFKRKITGPVRSGTTHTDSPADSQQFIRLAKRRNESYGMRLGYKLFVEGLNEHGVAAANGLRKGDHIIRINDQPVEQISLSDAHSMIERAKEGLDLDIMRPTGSRGDSRSDFNDDVDFTPPPPRPPLPGGDSDDDYGKRTPEMRRPDMRGSRPREPVETVPAPFEERKQYFPPPRPPSPDADEFRDSAPVVDLEGDSHYVSFNKGSSVGIKLIGGNEVGIYVAGIKPGSPAEQSGVAIADRIVAVNDDVHLAGLTKEEVALLLLTLPDFIKLEVKHSRAAFRKVMDTGRGDKFYIKAHFAYNPSVGEELTFPRGTVFRVTDTFPEGAMGYWYAIRLDRNNVATERGLIPNNSRATQHNMAQQSVEIVRIHNQSGTRSEFFKRRGIRASGRRGKNAPLRIDIEDEYDDIVFGGSPIKFPAYEKVILGTVGFMRPVVIFGPLADIARDKLLGAMPDRFETPLTEHSFDRTPGERLKINSQGSVKLGSIKDIMDKNKHCVLDVTPHAVEQLNLMQFYPIVIFLNPESRSQVKEVRGHYMSPEQNKGSKKLYKTSLTLKKAFAHLFTAMIPLTTDESWVQNIKEAVRIQQRKEIWMSENKFEEELDDSILPVVGPVILPEGYDTDAESIMHDTTVNSNFDSDGELSPTATPNTSSAPASEPAFNFTNNQELRATPKSELPKSDPPPKRYSSDEEEESSSFSRRQQSRGRSRKKKESIWSSLRRSMSRSRSRSRDRRKEGREMRDEEEEEEERREKEREQREREEREREEKEREEVARRLEEERNRQNTLDKQKYELSMELEQQRQREIAEEALKNQNQNRNAAAGDDHSNLSQLAKEFEKFDMSDVVTNGVSDPELFRSSDQHSEPEPVVEAMIQAASDTEEESAPPPPMMRSGPPKPAERKHIHAVASPSQHFAPIETDLDAVSNSFTGYGKSMTPKKENSVLETTFGPEDSQSDSSPPPPRRQVAPKPKKEKSQPGWDIPDFEPDAMPPPARMPSRVPPPQKTKPPPARLPTRPPPPDTDEDDDAPPKPALPPALPPTKPVMKPKPVQPKPIQPIQSKPVESKPLERRTEPKPLEPKLLERKPIEPKPLPPKKAPPKPVETKPEHRFVEPKPVEPKPVEVKPAEPVYSQVQKSKPSPRQSPLGWDMSIPEPSSQNNNNTSQRWDMPKEDVQTFTVGSGFVNAEVKKVDLGGDKSEDELSADAYRNQLANMAKLYGRSESPRGWSGGKRGNPQIKHVTPPKPTTGQTGNAYLDSKRARENFFMGENSSMPKTSGMPYDRDSYQAHKERSMKRSQSPGRLYQEKTGIYPPKNNFDKLPKAIPVDEAALTSDEGQEVIATMRGTFDSNGGVLNSPTTGVSITIPKGAISEGIRQEIYFKVCRDNSMLPPLDKNKGETLLSPLVMCGPHGLKFMKPVELKLPHTASNSQDGWQFNLKSSDAGQGEPAQWKNVNIPGMAGTPAQPVAKTVSVMVDHF